MRRLILLTFLLLLAACADWPDVPASETAEATDWPVLLPLDEIGAGPDDPERDASNEALLRRAEGLRNRAAVLRQPIEDDDAMERLRRSLDD